MLSGRKHSLGLDGGHLGGGDADRRGIVARAELLLPPAARAGKIFSGGRAACRHMLRVIPLQARRSCRGRRNPPVTHADAFHQIVLPDDLQELRLVCGPAQLH